MKTILFHERSIQTIDTYIDRYEAYFFDLFTDTGLFNEETIRENYMKEARNRRDDIFERIIARFSPEIVLGRTPENTLFLPWRSKVLFVTWQDEGEIRVITDLKIYED